MHEQSRLEAALSFWEWLHRASQARREGMIE
jgi:hypothetical protein